MSWESLSLLVTRHKDNKDYLARLLRRIFSYPENITLFAQFCLPNHCPTTPPPFHRQLLQHFVAQPGNKGAGAPRGFAKSTNISLVAPLWCIVNERKHFICLISDTYGQSVEFVNTIRDELASNEVIQWIYGDLRSDKWQEGNFVTSTDVKVMARAYGMKIRGLKFKQYRPDLIIFDDLENDESVSNPQQRAKLKKWLTRAALPAMAKGAEAWIVGTMLHNDSLLQNIVSRKGEFSSWKTKLYKAIWIDANNEEHSLWPRMYTVDELKAMRDDPTYERYIGSIAFAQEYQNEPRSDEDSIFKEDWIQWADALPTSGRTRTIVTVDPAISKKDTADFTAKIGAVLIGDRLNGEVYIFEIGNSRLSFAESIAEIRQWNDRIRPSRIYVETVAYQEALRESLSGLGLPVEAIERDKDKVRRAIAVSQHFQAGRVKILRNIRNAELLYNQLTQFPLGAHDDLVDATVDAVDRLIGKKHEPRIIGL